MQQKTVGPDKAINKCNFVLDMVTLKFFVNRPPRNIHAQTEVPSYTYNYPFM